jgi:hypothetical protein
MDIKEIGWEMWSGYMCLKRGVSGRLLWKSNETSDTINGMEFLD